MPERSIVTRLRADISDLKAKYTEAARLTDNIGEASKRASNKTRVSFDAMSGHIRSNEAGLNSLSNTALGFGGGLALAVGGVVKTFAGFDKQMSNVAATGDDARQNIDALRETAIQLGADSAFSASQAAAGVENLLKAGVSAADVMGGGLKGSLDLAAAGSLEVGDAAEIAATALTQFKLEGSDIPHVADLLAAGAGKAQGEVSDLAGALNQSGLVASQFGLSIEDTTGTLAAFASAGLTGSDAGTSFKTMLLALANPSEKTAKTMDRLNIAAYDAQGNFVGVAALADQLKNNLGGLTQAQRDQAMAQIFGNDAVRAANVLFTQGGAGITDWTNKVNDQGFAAETAATKLDNLAGDFEKFQGAMESAFIQSGSGANDALRGITQRATGLAEAIGEIPGPALEAGLGVAAVGAAGLLAVGGVGKLATGIVNTKDAFDALVPAGSKARGAVASFGKVAAGAAVGIAVYSAAVTALAKAAETPTLVSGLEDTQAAVLRLGDSSAGASANLDALFQSTNKSGETTGLTSEVRDLGSALDAALSPDWDIKVGKIGEGFVTLGGSLAKTSADKVADQFKQLDTALTQMKPEEAAAGFAEVARQAADQGIEISKLVTLFPEYRAQLVAQANELGVTTLSAEDYADWMGGRIPDAIQRATAASGGATDAIGKTGAAMGDLEGTQKDLREAQDRLRKSVDDIKSSFSVLRDEVLSADAATDDWEGSLDNLSKSVKENGKSLDRNTDASRANRRAVRDSISAMNDKITADFLANVETKGLTKATDIASGSLKSNRKRLEEAATAAGFSKREIRKMIDQMVLTPDELRTKVDAPGVAETKAEIKKLKEEIEKLKSRDVTVTASMKLKADRAVFDKMGIRVAGVNSPGGLTRAEGGPIPMIPGATPGRDSVPVMAMPDEHMWTTRETQAVGGHAAMFRLRSAALEGKLKGYANGGPITRDLRVHGRALNTEAASQLGDAYDDVVKEVRQATRATTSALAKSFMKDINDAVAASTAGGSGNYSAARPGRYGDERFTSEQLRNAATIASVGAGLGKRAIQIGIMTAIVESGLRNLNFGDRDSLGLFQQRAPWGSAAARRNPRTSAGMFFHGGRGGQRGLDDIPGWRGMSMGRAAQAVQVSAFPGRYQTKANEAADIMAAMRQTGAGGGPAGTGTRKRVQWKGGTFTERFRNTLINAERLAGTDIRVMQGGFSSRVAASGASHLGDAIDTQWDSRVLSGLRRAKVAAWHRTPAQGFVHHIHGIPLPGYGYAGGSGVWQAQDYLRGGNGLYTGTSAASAGWHWVGERGPELRHFRGGETVLNASKSKAAVQVAARVKLRPAAAIASSTQQRGGGNVDYGDTIVQWRGDNISEALRKADAAKRDKLAMMGLA